MITALGQGTLRGLTSSQAAERLQQYGLNHIPEEHKHPIRAFLSKFVGPVPFMLEGTLLLQLLLGKYVDGIIVATVLVVRPKIRWLCSNRN